MLARLCHQEDPCGDIPFCVVETKLNCLARLRDHGEKVIVSDEKVNRRMDHFSCLRLALRAFGLEMEASGTSPRTNLDWRLDVKTIRRRRDLDRTSRERELLVIAA